MNLRQLFNFNNDILANLDDISKALSSPLKGNKQQRDVVNDSNAHIVGQCTDNQLLFTWDCKKEKGEKQVTFFGVFNLTNKKSSILFDYDRKVDVVTASVNEEMTLLAFTVVEYKSSSEHSNEIYKSFIAEIFPKNRIFSLGVEQPHYQRVQFLYGKYPLYGNSPRRESHMLFFNHSQSIDLYHIPLARNYGGMVMSGQPQVEHITKRFLWAQFDSLNKRLYYVYPEEGTQTSKDEEPTEKFMFSALQFCEKSPRVVIVNMACPFPLKSANDAYNSDCFQYDRKALSTVVSESCVNMSAISSPEGSFFLCFQHPPTVCADVTENSMEATTSEGKTENGDVVEYSILMAHHGSILNCKVPNVVPRNWINKAKLTFTMLYDCLAVILPGHIFHLLDCNAEHPPCHHLILQDFENFELPESNEPYQFISINEETLFGNKQELCFFEPKDNNIYTLKFDNTYWTDCFLRTHRDTTRLALLHFSILHLQDLEISLKVFNHLVCDPANLECLGILKEYLIGSTFFQMKLHVESLVYNLLPFSNTEPFRGHLETDKTGKQIARIVYFTCKTDGIFTQNLKDQDEKRKELDYWLILKRNILSSTSIKRFSLKYVAMMGDDEEAKNGSPTTSLNTGLSSLLRRFRKFPAAESSVSSSTEISHESVPEFLCYVKSDPVASSKEERSNMKVLDSLTRYLHHYLPSEIPKLKIQKMATDYTKCQRKQAAYLLKMFWSELDYTDDTHPYHQPLNIRGSRRDRALLMLLERYHVAVKELCFPTPPGFQTFFTFMGFRCLEQNLFSRYVTNDVFQVGSDFMLRLLEDVGGDDSYSELISRLILMFEQSKAVHFLQIWNKAGVRRLLCQRYVSNMLATDSVPFQSGASDFYTQSQRFDDYEKTMSSFMSSTEETSEIQTIPFRPLVNVLTSLESASQLSKAQQVTREGGSRLQSTLNSELEFVARHAMEYTAEKVDNSLGLLTF